MKKIKWPVWYFALMIVMMFLVSVDIATGWMAWAYLFLGFTVWGFKRVNK